MFKQGRWGVELSSAQTRSSNGSGFVRRDRNISWVASAPFQFRAGTELTFRRSRMQFGMNFPGLFLRVERLLWDAEQSEHLLLQVARAGTSWPIL